MEDLETYVRGLLWAAAPAALGHEAGLLRVVLPHLCLSPVEFLGTLDDESLVLAVQKKFLPGEAYQALMVQRYEPYLARWCARWRVPAADRDDLRQDLQERFWRTRFKSYIAQGNNHNFRAFLYTCAYRLWVGLARRRKREQPLDPASTPSVNGHGPEAEALAADLGQRLEAALEDLPEPRQAIMRGTLKGQPPGEIALGLGLSVEAVCRGLFHARNSLEKALALPRRNADEKVQQ